MSKMDDMRAMREARYQRAGATPPRTGEPASRPAKPVKAARPAPVAPDDPSAPGGPDKPATQGKKAPAHKKTAPAAAPGSDTGDGLKDGTGSPAVEALCGHRAISGRTCTREQGHAAKSHRYS